MSRYQVDKAMRQVILDLDAYRAYKEEPLDFLGAFDLLEEEHAALLQLDYRNLYRLGAHPFLLNGFVMRVWPGRREELRAKYNEDLADIGYPDFST
jgi:hypothetical protein